jgi:hypothetical protein
MNYFPVWVARIGDREVAIRSHDGQLAFAAPADGDYVVDLAYPPRHGLLVFAVLGWCAGAVLLARTIHEGASERTRSVRE